MSWLSKGIRGVGKAIKKNPVLSAGLAAGAMFIPGAQGVAMGALKGIGGKLAAGAGKVGLGKLATGGALKSVGSWALRNPDAILGGLSAVQGYQKGRQADRMVDRALNDPGLNPERPDYSDTFSGYSNPYSGSPNPFGEEARMPAMVDRPMPLRRVGRRYA